MSTPIFILIVVSSILIAAAANIHNDIHDVDIDRLTKSRKPIPNGDISIKSARYILYLFNSLGVILTFLAAHLIGEPFVAIFQLSILALLFAYSNSLKCSKLVGNIVVSLTVAMVPVVVWIYIVYDNSANGLMFNYDLRWMHLSIFFFSLFAFLSTLIREIVKDREDMKADTSCNCNTWAATVSLKSFKILISILSIFLIAIIAFYQLYLPNLEIYRISFFIPMALILFGLIPMLLKGSSSKDFKKLSTFLKIIILSGLVTPIILLFCK
ncbi:MAG: UbiA family prenyltransferase [Bacteroidales bacterium]|nr:UbiA family prenyltransferase [Bacteroidales bacterium]